MPAVGLYGCRACLRPLRRRGNIAQVVHRCSPPAADCALYGLTVLWVKAFHLVFMVTWFAGLFYLPRLFVYHAMAQDDISHRRFEVMERKLYFGIMTPGGVLTLVFGVWLASFYDWQALAAMRWLHVKLALVLVLVGYHLWCGRLLRAFREGRNRHSHVWYRWFNEAPVLGLIVIVLLAVLKPGW